MPCGLVSPGARAKVAAAFWLPEVRVAAPTYWKTFHATLSTIQMSLTLLRLIVIPVGWAFAGSMAQLPSSEPDSVYLKTFSAVPSTTQNDVPSVTMSWGLGLPFLPLARLKLLAAVWLPERRLAAPAYL